jgi:hypothetical protein
MNSTAWWWQKSLIERCFGILLPQPDTWESPPSEKEANIAASKLGGAEPTLRSSPLSAVVGTIAPISLRAPG